MSEVVRDGVDGVLFPPGNTVALATVIEALVKDRSSLRQLGANAPRPKSVHAYAQELVQLYDEILLTRETRH
jgi:glycosyltransferase involved in cell wall biosynthesis